MLSINGPNGIGTGIQHERQGQIPSSVRAASLQGGGLVSNVPTTVKDELAISQKFQLVRQMPIDKLREMGIIKKENGSNKRISDEPLKRSRILAGLYNTVTKDGKVCRKCQHLNPFFRQECEKCDHKYGKTRGERGAGSMGSSLGQLSRGMSAFEQGLLNGMSNLNLENYSVLFWELL